MEEEREGEMIGKIMTKKKYDEKREEAMTQVRRFTGAIDNLAPPSFEEEEEEEKEEELEERLNYSEEALIAKGVLLAKKAFYDYFDSQDLDPAHWRLKIVVETLDSGFEEVLERVTWEDLA